MSSSFDANEWSIIHYYVERTNLNKITEEIIPKIKTLETTNKIKNFFYFRYTIPEDHLKIVVCRNSINHEDIVNQIKEFSIITPLRKDTEFMPVKKTDIIQGIPDFLLSASGRKMSEIIKQEFGTGINHFQAYFILHYFFNNINFSNLDEAKVAFYHINDFFQKLG